MISTRLDRNMPEQVARVLRMEILSGVCSPGSPLKEAVLSKRFQVSPGPIRDALARLVQEGLVVIEPNKGAKVAFPPNEEFRVLLCGLRKQIEEYALNSVFNESSELILSRWETILKEIRTACEVDDEQSLKENDILFHRVVIEIADEPQLEILWQTIIMRIMHSYPNYTMELMDVYGQHERIVDAIRTNDKAETIKQLKANII